MVPTGSPITGFSQLAPGQRIGVVQGTVQEAYVVDTLHLQPVKFPDYNTVYASLKTRQIDAWVAPSQQASGTVQPGDPAQIIENTFSLDNFVAWAVAKENQPLIDALNSGLDAVIADGTWAKLYSDWVPRALPPGWKPGSKAAPAPQLPDFAAIAAAKEKPAAGAPVARQIHTGATGGLVPGLGALQAGRPRPATHRPAQHADPDRVRQRHRAGTRDGAWRWRVSRGPGGCAGRPGCTPTSSADCPKW